MSFEKNERLKVVKPGWQGNPLVNNKFINQGDLFLPSMKKALKWQFTPNPQKAEKRQDQWRPLLTEGDAFLQSGDDMIVWLGHATFFMRLNGVSFITDPIFYGMPMYKRLTGLPCPPENICNLDYILLSHGHRDHCDESSLKLLCRNCTPEILTTLCMGGLLKKWFPHIKVQEAGWYQQYELREAGIEIIMLPAYHWHRRGLNDINSILWGSFLVRTPKYSIYFGGDSAYKPHFKEIGNAFPGIDYCMIGVGAYSPSFMMQQSHTSPKEAVQAFHDLGAKTFIPMHFGTYDLADEPIGEPYRVLTQMQASGQINGELMMPGIGQIFKLQ